MKPHLLLRELESVSTDDVSMRAGKAFAIRNLLNLVPAARSLTNSPVMRSLVDPVLGSRAKVVRGIYFDKHQEANWKVACYGFDYSGASTNGRRRVQRMVNEGPEFIMSSLLFQYLRKC